MIATVMVGPPAAIGHAEGIVAEKPDPTQGVWLQLASDGRRGTQRLLRVQEDGRAREVPLPAILNDAAVQAEEGGLEITPLPGGWLAAVARYLPAGAHGCCRGIEEFDDFECCARWVFAERGPRGHWTTARVLPHSSGSASWVSEAVETRGGIEIAWGERYSGELHVARAPLGGRLQAAHRVPPLSRLEGGEGEVSAQAEDGGLYEVDEATGVRLERRLFGDGRLGALHVIRNRRIQTESFFTEPGGAQLLLYTVGPFDYLIARRAAFAQSLQPPHFLLAHVTGSPEEAARSSADGWVLLAMEKEVRGERLHLDAIAVTPSGVPRRRLLVEPDANEDYFEDAIGEHGEWLLVDMPWRGARVFLHPYSPRCPYRRQNIALSPPVPMEFDLAFSVAAGRRGVFHVLWTDAAGELELNSVRVVCGTKAVRETAPPEPPAE